MMKYDEFKSQKISIDNQKKQLKKKMNGFKNKKLKIHQQEIQKKINSAHQAPAGGQDYYS